MDTTKSSAAAHPPKVSDQQRQARLEERYRHDLMDEEERCELRGRILRLGRKLSWQRYDDHAEAHGA